MSLKYVADVTIPDGSVIQPGKSFLKTWRVLNSSDRDWPETAIICFCGGVLMAEDPCAAIKPVKAGDTMVASVRMTAPKIAGEYKSYWRVCDGDECTGEQVYVLISVPAATHIPSPTTSRQPTVAKSPTKYRIPTLKPQPVAPQPVIRSCCKRCNCPSTKPCGDSCISASKSCNKGVGCACCK